MLRAVGRWQLVGLSVNDVIGSGIYLLPAAAAALLGPASVWAVLLAGLAVSLLVLCYAQAASYFDQAGGSYLYAREAFGRFTGFEVGWMLLLARVSSAAALSNGLADAVAHFWPAAGGRSGRLLIVVGSLVALTWINVIGVRAAARTGVTLAIAKFLPLAMFVIIGAFFVDLSQASPLAVGSIPMGNLAKGALLLLFAYAGFENMPAAAAEYRNPRRDVPFAMLTMIVIVTATYVSVQWVALGTLPGLAHSSTPLADASARFAGMWLALVLTVGAAVSILGTNSNTIMFGPRYLLALADDGFGPAALTRIHPRFRTPAVAIVVVGALSLALALSGSFVQLALLSVVARLFGYLATAASVLVLRKRHGHRDSALQLIGGPLIPVAATLLSLVLLGSAGVANLLAAAVALLIGALIYRFWRRPVNSPAESMDP
ncbi:amino acid transporter [Rhodanobacter sp. B05]|uniref:APC family permease n=1 Tax=Rhodanobacter sp. B05 TaxID=1945859 RepID=UPI000987A3F3|nr:APC family permease [Rhodanobacter sp. B05]OOG57747.1 amino acid transporter [Rhodanobacter sp. B05]